MALVEEGTDEIDYDQALYDQIDDLTKPLQVADLFDEYGDFDGDVDPVEDWPE